MKTLLAFVVAVGTLLGGPGLAQSHFDNITNVTTTFDGVEFRLRAFIQDPDEPEKFRMVAQIENTGEQDRWILYIAPAPRFIDDYGNVYDIDLVTGIEACRSNNGNWTADVSYCDRLNNPTNAVRLAPNVAVTTMLRFVPSDDESFTQSLADLATSGELRIIVTTSPESFASARNAAIHQVIIPSVLIPREGANPQTGGSLVNTQN